MEKIVMAHGSGGQMTDKLIKEVFAAEYGNEMLSQMEDATVVSGSEKIAITTDSFVVTPAIFPGGDIGRLAVCGTVNDLLMRGAKPKYITAAFILEEGLEIFKLREIVKSFAKTAKESGVLVVAGDTKVIDGAGGIYINTTGVGFISNPYGIDRVKKGDVIIVSGNMGDHHAAIMAARLGFSGELVSDNAPLNKICEGLSQTKVHAMRDVTRGGLATVLKEIAKSSGKNIEIEEEKIPVAAPVKSFAGITGLDPLYMGNEGKLVAFVEEAYAEEALRIIKACEYGENAAIIGKVVDGEDGALYLKTALMVRRELDILSGEGLPRIC